MIYIVSKSPFPEDFHVPFFGGGVEQTRATADEVTN